MARDQEIAAKLQQALAAAERCSAAESARNYEVLCEEMQELRSAATRSSRAHADCVSLLDHLRAGEPLSPDEMATLRLMIVGDAEYYLKYDEEFQRCKTEIGRLLNELGDFENGEFDLDALMHIGVLCEETCKMLAMTSHYLAQRDRVRSFEAATSGPLDQATGRSLANIIREMVNA